MSRARSGGGGRGRATPFSAADAPRNRRQIALLDNGMSGYGAPMIRLSPPSRIPDHPVFRGFAVEQPWHVPGYRRNLPHLRLEGATYFVTFRLADSIPQSVASRWEDERRAWLRAHGLNPDGEDTADDGWDAAYAAIPAAERHAFEREQQRRFFVELDKCHGACLLATCPGLVGEAIEHFHGQRIWAGDYVVMPNHVHVLVQPFPGVELEQWLYSIKRFTGVAIRRGAAPGAVLRRGHLWQTESFDRIVRNAAELARIRRYIADNPSTLRPGSFALKRMPWLDAFA
jgi:putative transposase